MTSFRDINQVCQVHNGNKFQDGTRCGLCVDEACTFWYSDCCDAKISDEATITVIENDDPAYGPDGTGTCPDCDGDTKLWIAIDEDMAKWVHGLPIQNGVPVSGTVITLGMRKRYELIQALEYVANNL
tara:strand:+ start:5467 stop:5850 length:384 start_codon:yes stop_codon:yes gene_type:complete